MKVLLFLIAAWLASTTTVYASPITQFDDLKELKGKTADLEMANEKEEKWFPPDSNYGRLFLEGKSTNLMISWLGTLSKLFAVEPDDIYRSRSFIKLTANYYSRRSEDSPIMLSLLVPHPRSVSSRTLNLIPEFSELEKKATSAPISEHLDISGFPADLGLDFDNQLCFIAIPLPRLSLLYIETKDCRNRKKLLDFCETIDVVRLAAKLEK